MLRLAAATAAVIAVSMGALYLRYSGEVWPREAEPWAVWIAGDLSKSIPQPVELVYDESLVASANVAPQEACRPVFTWGSDGMIMEPIGQTLQEIRLSNTCNEPDPSSAKATSTWDTAHAWYRQEGPLSLRRVTHVCPTILRRHGSSKFGARSSLRNTYMAA